MSDKDPILKRTGGTEGFYRRAWNAAKPASSSPPPRRTFFGSVQHGDSNSADPAVKLGSLKPPGELGHQVSHAESFSSQVQPAALSSNQLPQVQAHPQTVRTRQRSTRAIRRSTDPSVTVAAVEHVRQAAAAEPQEPSLLASFSYRGMEVIFATSSAPACYGMCARTRLVFQTLDLPSAEPIISIRAHPATGQIVIAQADGSVQSYTPEPTDPKLVSFGRYRWSNGLEVKCADVFYSPNEKPVIRKKSGSDPGVGLDVSLSDDYKVLVAHRDQLAVFDANPALVLSANSDNDSSKCGPVVAELLWTTRLLAAVVTAKLSGDGQAIALVLSRSETADDDAEADGVHTFERDSEDGSQFDQAPIQRPLLKRESSLSVGILYKPGPFLVHSTPVTRLSFRGLGHVTSSVRPAESDQGNDLLLTYCASNCAARIFGQNNWKPLTEWKTPPSTRVDWVKGIAAFTLGDLESQKKPANMQSSSGPGSRRPSTTSMVSDDGSLALNETLGKRNHFHSIPNHSAPSSNAGAWITEVTFQGAFPAFRLSRLTYLKRGVDDLNPTLFETVAAFLPAGSILEDCVRQCDSEGLSIEAIWPAWNPWLSQAADVDSTETLRGSAMAFLGLSSAPGSTTGGYFGDSVLGTTQSPPAEIRMVASHPLTGKVVVLEIPLFGDQHLSSLELGNPIRSVLSLSDLDAEHVSEARYPLLAKRMSASMDYESSRLVANIVNNSKSVSLTWNRPGTASILPADWLPEDVADPHNAAHLLSETKRFQDESLLPVPLALPQVRIPDHVEGVGGDETVHTVLWWPDHSFGGTPLLLTVLSSGTILVFELPPPWSALEPKLPESLESSPAILTRGSNAPESDDDSLDDDSDYMGLTDNYTVAIAPDPEYGLGLRLESQADGMPAIAGSFKKHPLSEESLPAEKAGMINLGDELVCANDVNLEDKSFDDIIAAVREQGANCGPGNPMRMTFRRMNRLMSRANSSVSDAAAVAPESIQSPGRRSMGEMLGVQSAQRSKTPGDSSAQGDSQNMPDKEGHTEDTAHAGGNQQRISSVVGVFPSAFSSLVEAQGSDETRPLLSLVPYTDLADESRKAALLFSAEGGRIHARRVVLSSDPENATMTELGSCDVLEGRSTSSPKTFVRAMEVIELEAEKSCLAVCDSIGVVRLIFVSLEAPTDSLPVRVSFRQFQIFRVGDPCPTDLLLRGGSIETMATMHPDIDGKCRKITVWTGRPHPGCHLGREALSSELDDDDDLLCNYSSIEVRIESIFNGTTSKENEFVDFCFQRSGFLDASPSLLVFSLHGAAVYQRLGGKADWIPITEISYCGIPGSNPSGRAKPLQPDYHWFGSDRNPRDSFPHLIPAMQSVFPAFDEKTYLRADWHPDSLLARICADPRGANSALRKHVRELYIWLCSEGRDISEDHMQGPLIVAPFSIGENGNVNEEVDVDPRAKAESVMASLSSNGALAGNNDELLNNLQSLLLNHLAAREMGVRRKIPGFDLETVASDTQEISPLVRSMNQEDLLVLWGLGELVLESPDFESLDVCGQLFSFSAALFRRMKNVPRSEETRDKQPTYTMPAYLERRSPSSTKDDNCNFPTVAAAGCLAALLSNSQGRLLERCRQPGEKMSWSLARELKIPFWVRSDTALARLSEEIGQSIYREKKDILECALFFIIARKMRTLRNLAATDPSLSGRMFCKFLSDHDFSSERGRRAAEKNAFSLLRKCRYGVAAAFFLLAEPPALKSALETIVTKMKDLDLAFLVARLMESDLPGQGGSLGAGGGFGGVLGGGGGYVAGGFSQPSLPSEDEKDFNVWKPCVGKATRVLLIERGLPLSASDNSMTAIQLLWLERKEEASWWLAGSVKVSYGKETVYDVVDDAAQRGFAAVSGISSEPEGSRQPTLAITKVNALIDFMSAPMLLRSMDASVRARFASSLTVSSGLSARGLEGASIRSIMEYTDTLDLEEKDTVVEDSQVPVLRAKAADTTASSIFDAFDSPPIPKPVNAPSHAIASSSIFDSFDAPPPTIPKCVPSSSGGAPSSIFDSFDVPPSPQGSKIPPQTSEAQSSIFDSFDAAPQAQQSRREVQSSIFDSFDTAPQKQQPKVPQSSEAQSSIFDSFDAAPQRQQPKVPQSSEAQSSIFDSFDAAPQKQQPKVPASIQDPLSSSIFDSFGPPPSSTGQTSSPLTPAPPRAPSALEAENGTEVKEVEDLITIKKMPTPALWMEWRDEMVFLAAARRLLREVASVLALIHGDPSDPSIQDFYRRQDPLVPSGASEVLQLHCDAEGIMARVQESLAEVCAVSNLNQTRVLNTALRLLGPSTQHHRLLFAAVLCSAAGDGHKTEDMVRSAASTLICRCRDFAFSFDDMVHQRKTRFHLSSQIIRREAARVSWQLEICLWMNRGGGLPLSGTALKEAIIAVRLGLLVASWNQNYVCLEAMIRSPPDCLTDEEAGRPLWTSLKILPSLKRKSGKPRKTNSGGWEFLVDCRRSQATEMLRERTTGCFIIRPHSEDHVVFTLSFKTNLLPDKGQETEVAAPDDSGDELSDPDGQARPPLPPSKKVRKDDVVQHAIVRLSDSGFRCGSFGPFTSLMDLLEAVSSSLPFKLRFDKPPTNRVIKEEGSQPSPNAVFLRRLALTHADSLVSNPPMHDGLPQNSSMGHEVGSGSDMSRNDEVGSFECKKSTGVFLELLLVSLIRKQLSGVAAVEYDDSDAMLEQDGAISGATPKALADQLAGASRILGPLLTWCRSMESLAVVELSPDLRFLSETDTTVPVDLTESPDAIEVAPHDGVSSIDGGDAVLRRMIQRGSGVDFSTLRLLDGGECTLVVLFSRNDAVKWLLSSGSEQSEADAITRLERMDKKRVIEPIDLSRLHLKQKGGQLEEKGVRYRFVDPWEVEALSNREGETRSATLGRSSFLGFGLGKASMSAESVFRSIGGVPLLELWTAAKGGVALTKALASVHPPWERSAGGDLQVTDGTVTEPPPYANSIRQHLYRNALFRRLDMPQRFVALVQVELLDLKNLTSPGGSLSLSVYALLRLKRSGSGSGLTNKARTLDSAATHPVKLGKTSGPNAPASWGSVVRFRFPLPEDVALDGASYDGDREVLFKGPPSVLQVSVYEKKLLVDHSLGTADIRTDGLWAGDQLEEWVPLRSEKHAAISWFARIRLTLRFELMCLAPDDQSRGTPPSVGLQKIEELSRTGGAAHEDSDKSDKRSMSSPDLLSYFESIVYQ